MTRRRARMPNLPGAQMALEIFDLFQPLQTFIVTCYIWHGTVTAYSLFSLCSRLCLEGGFHGIFLFPLLTGDFSSHLNKQSNKNEWDFSWRKKYLTGNYMWRGGGGTHMLRHTGMCCPNGLLFHQKAHGSHFGQKISFHKNCKNN